MKKLNVCFCSIPFYSSHAKALYLFMRDNYPLFNLYWVVYTEEEKNKLTEKNIKAYVINTKEFYKQMDITDLFFTTHGNLTAYKNSKSIYVELWHGIGVKPAGYLINNLSEFDEKWTNEFRKKIDYFIVPTEFWKIIFSCLFQLDPRRVLPLGYPKFYIQEKSDGINNIKKILNINPNKYKKIILYLPTIRKAEDKKLEISIDKNKIFGFKDENINDLNDFLKNNNYLLCIKYHPSELNYSNIIENNNIKIIDNETMKLKCIDIDEILNCADIIISDYSSILIETIYLRKKVIFLNNSINEFYKNRGIFFDNYDYWSNNLSINSYENLKKQILTTEKNINEEKYKMWFGNIKDGGCQNIIDYFIQNDKIKKEIKQNDSIEIMLENDLAEKNAEIYNNEKKIENLILKNEENEKKIEYIAKELNDIASSKAYKFARMLQKIRQTIFRR